MKKFMLTAAVAALVVTVSAPAFAQGQMSDMLMNTQKNLGSIPNFINWVAYIIGVALGVAGVSKLKAHVDNPGQTSVKDGLGRLAASGLFISLPFMLDMIRSTQAVGNNAGTIQTFNDALGDSSVTMSGQ